MAEPKTILHPEAAYKISAVGPVNDWSFNGDSGPISMKGYSIQVEGVADWSTLNQAATTDAPKVGDTVEGHIEDGGKFGLKFVKKKKQGGGWSGGGKSSPGAQWSAAYQTAATLLQAYAAAGTLKVKDIGDLLEKTAELAAVIKAKVDESAGTAQAEAPKQETNEGLPVVDTENNPVVIDDVKPSELGKW